MPSLGQPEGHVCAARLWSEEAVSDDLIGKRAAQVQTRARRKYHGER